MISQSEAAKAAVNGIEIAYDTFGNPADPPLLLIMGLGMQMIAWDEALCEQLAKKDYWVIRFDNRDVGLSTRLDHLGRPGLLSLILGLLGRSIDAPYLLSDMAADTVGLLDALGIDSAHVVGVSMGGMIAQTVAIAYPERVRTLTSIMSSTGDPSLPRAKPRVMRVLTKRPPSERADYIENTLDSLRLLSGPAYPIDEERIRRRAGRAFDRGLSPRGVARQLAAIMASGSRKEALHNLEVPTLVIHGDADPLVPVEHGIDTADSIPGAELMIIKGMGHELPPPVWPQLVTAIAKHARDEG